MTEFSFSGELLAIHWPLHGSLKSVCSKKEITNLCFTIKICYFQECNDVMGIMCSSNAHMCLIWQILLIESPDFSLVHHTQNYLSVHLYTKRHVHLRAWVHSNFNVTLYADEEQKNTVKFTRITKHLRSERKWTRDTAEEMRGKEFSIVVLAKWLGIKNIFVCV